MLVLVKWTPQCGWICPEKFLNVFQGLFCVIGLISYLAAQSFLTFETESNSLVTCLRCWIHLKGKPQWPAIDFCENVESHLRHLLPIRQSDLSVGWGEYSCDCGARPSECVGSHNAFHLYTDTHDHLHQHQHHHPHHWQHHWQYHHQFPSFLLYIIEGTPTSQFYCYNHQKVKWSWGFNLWFFFVISLSLFSFTVFVFHTLSV